MQIDLKRTAGISLSFDGSNLSSSDLLFKNSSAYTIKQLKTELINDDLAFPEYFYTKYTAADINSAFKSKKIKLNFYTVAPGVAGIEFIKTLASVVFRYSRLVEIIHGAGIIILQKFVDEEVQDIIISKVRVNDKIIIPPDYHAVFINTKSQFFIVSEITSTDAKLLYQLEEMRGLAYYIISKNSRPEIVRNPNYKTAPKHRRADWTTLVNKLSISPKTPIIKQILRKYEKFGWLFKENSGITI